MKSPALSGSLLMLLCASPIAAQNERVEIRGNVPTPRSVTAQDLAALPKQTVKASDHGRPPAEYEGVRLIDVLQLAGVEVGSKLRGPRLAEAVLVEARDGYRVVFALAELDSAFTSKQVLLVNKQDGAALDAEAGPWRLVVADEKRPARWIRQVSKISVVTVKE